MGFRCFVLFAPGAWPTMAIFDKALACKMGLGVFGKKHAQTVQLLISFNSLSTFKNNCKTGNSFSCFAGHDGYYIPLNIRFLDNFPFSPIHT
jgi:hypothetical protein